jgi:hypothetical protein
MLRLPLPNQRLQLALPAFGVRPLAVLRRGHLRVREHLLVAFVQLTPALRWGAAETHNR